MKYASITAGILIMMMIRVLPAAAQSDFWQASGLDPYDVQAVAAGATGFVYAGTMANGIHESTDNGADWTNIGFSEQPFTNVAVNAAGVIFAGNWNKLFRTTDRGASWQIIISPGDTGPDIGGIHVSAQNILYVSVMGPMNTGVFRSTDNGTYWTLCSNGITANLLGPISTNASGHIFLGTNGGVFRSTDNGQNWSAMNTGLPPALVTAILAAPDGTTYAGLEGAGMYRSTNGGAEWQEINANLGTPTIRSIAVNSLGHLFVAAAGTGVFRSIDRGDNWQAVNSGLTNPNVAALAVSPAGGNWPDYIFAGTNGSGIFRSRSSTVIPAPLPAQPGQNSACLPQEVTLRWNIVAQAESYALQVSDDPAFTDFLFNVENISDTFFVASALPAATTLHWRVRGANVCGFSGWSATRSFSTTLAPPVPASPPDGAGNVPVPVTLVWDASPSAASYRLQIARALDFSFPILDQAGIALTEYVVAGLPEQSQLFWRVNAAGGGCTSGWSAVWNFTTAAALPEVPLLSSPPDSAVNLPADPILVWLPAARAERYHLQVSTDPFFIVPVFDRDTICSVSCRVPNLACEETHYWRVRATNGSGASGWSSVWSFRTVMRPPDPPLLESPPDGAVQVPTNPTLVWNRAPRADFYRLQVAMDDAFSGILFDLQNIPDSALQIPLLPRGTACSWRVNASNAGGAGGWSVVWSFRTASALPLAPLLKSPADSATGMPVTLHLRWHQSAGAAAYRLQVSRDPAFADPMIDQASIADTSLLASNLDPDAMHYWRVLATNASGTSPWSEVWRFRTIPLPPEAPTLESPPDLATGIPACPAFRWRAALRALSYHLQASTMDNFSMLALDQDGISDTAWSGAVLSGDTRYYWRAGASNGAGAGPWSVVWSFRTGPAPPAAPILLAPADGATGVSRSPRMQWYPSPGADSYRIQIALDDACMNVIRDQAGIAGTDWIPLQLDTSALHYWRVNGTNAAGAGPWSAVWRFRTEATTRAAPSPPSTADAVSIETLYPNPCADRMIVGLRLTAARHMRLEILDLLGRRAALLLEGERERGEYQVTWKRAGLPAGVYVLRLTAGEGSALRPFVAR